MTRILALVAAFEKAILSKCIKLLCAACGKEWRGGHECEKGEG
jgi:hypothetical protein